MEFKPYRTAAVLAGVVLTAGVLASCGSDEGTTEQGGSTTSSGTSSEHATSTTGGGEPVIEPGDGGNYSPDLDPADFVDVIDNPHLPMPEGAHWRYEGESDGEAEVVEVTVTSDRKLVMGISAVVVRDTVTVGGELVEDTYDWFAQDAEGNVWYLGEDVKDYEGGVVVSTEGSWTAGVDGALPGIVMPADPETDDVYRQEFYAGEAEDMMQILEVGGTLDVEAGSFDNVITTRDWSPLEPESVEEKAYAFGVGKIREEKTAGGDGFAELVDFSLEG